VELPQDADLAAVRDSARREGIVFASGAVFFTQPPARTCLRLNCAKASADELRHGLTRLGAILCEQAQGGA
jgi:DNA-binding transcriptional MocR family regulator